MRSTKVAGSPQASRPRNDENAARLVAAAATLGSLSVATGVEGVTTGAARDRVGVVHGEAATHQRVHVVDLRAFEVHRAEIVDGHAHAVGFNEFVTILGSLLD